MFRGGSAYPRSIVKATPLRSRACSAAVALAVVLLASPTRASEFLVSLDYQTDPALTGCPSPADFRKAIVRQLGHDPFRDNAPRRMLVRLFPAGPRMGGRVEWRDANDQWEGERTFSSRNESCAEMARAMALATAIQIDLLAIPDQAPPEKPAVDAKPPVAKLAEAKPPVAPPAPPVVAEPPAPAPAPKEPRIAVEVGVGALQDFGDAPIFVLPRLTVSVGPPLGDGRAPGREWSRPPGRCHAYGRRRPDESLRDDVGAGSPLSSGSDAPAAVGRRCRLAGCRGERDQRGGRLGTMRGRLSRGCSRRAVVWSLALSTRFSVVVELEALLYWPSLTVDVGSSQAAHLDGAALFAHGGLLARF